MYVYMNGCEILPLLKKERKCKYNVVCIILATERANNR